uniref:Neuralized E3 ubiquitin protein ligase 1B n=1 Tax=Nomascus leucogenys TaxID=61853 RepID=G1QHS3_NOMLE
PSPPARLLATRPCCGPGPERRPVLGEAPRFHAHAQSAQDIPKYACPDLVTRPGYWAKALPENLALRDTVLAYWADRHGRVFYSVNDGEPVLFHCGVAVGGPLWALIDVYGITDEVQLLGRSRARRPLGTWQRCLFPGPSRAPAVPPAFLATPRPACPPYVESPRVLSWAHSFLFTSLNCVIQYAYRKAFKNNCSIQQIVIKQRPLRPGESLFVELPADPDALLDRKEYWVVARAGPVPSGGDALSFTLRPGGDVLLGVNGRPRGRLLCVDTTQALWAFFAVRGGVAGQLRLLGDTLQSSPATTTPSGSLSGSQDDSDSDMTFSVNQSSSASESSLVTAPSSPLSPPVSPVFSPPEPAGIKNGECTVCFDGEVDTVIYTCGHMCLCHSCGLRLKRQARACCPICRRPIKDVIKIYRP